MKQSRHKARAVALQGLYQLDMQHLDADADTSALIEPLLAEADLQGRLRLMKNLLDPERYSEILSRYQ